MPRYLHGSAKQFVEGLPRSSSFLPALLTPQYQKNCVDESILMLSQRRTSPASLLHFQEKKIGMFYSFMFKKKKQIIKFIL